MQVELCASVDCPLWPVRPIRKDRIPFSLAVVTEYGMTGSEADARRYGSRAIRPHGGVAANSGARRKARRFPGRRWPVNAAALRHYHDNPDPRSSNPCRNP